MEIVNLTMSYGTQTIYKDVSIHIPEKENIGIVGVNGAGKTTLFKLILGQEMPDEGSIKLSNTNRIGWLPQVFEDDIDNIDISVYEYLKSGRPVEILEEKLQKQYESLGNENADIDKIYKKIDSINNKLAYWESDSCETTLLKIVDGIGISIDILDHKVSELSGGQKSKVAFARLLYSKPEILLLDEPTNHMDKDSKSFITNFIKNYHGTVFVISHDEEFLNEVTTKTLFIDKRTKKMRLFDGNYERFLKLENEIEQNIENEAKKQQAEEDKLRAIVNKYSNTSGKRKRLANDREKKLNKLLENKIEVLDKEKHINIKMTMDQELNNMPINIENIYFKYNENGPYVIENLSFSLYKGEKFLILGQNGAGKSTLLKLINNILVPESGNISIGNKVKIGYYAQEFENLDENLQIIENFDKKLSISKVRAVLGKFLFTGDDVYKKISVLSPGERARVALAKLSMTGANLLLLDEPTNHLDPKTQEIIGEVFSTFKGSIIVVSHNLDFVKKIGIERVLQLPTGKIGYYDETQVKYYQSINETN